MPAHVVVIVIGGTPEIAEESLDFLELERFVTSGCTGIEMFLKGGAVFPPITAIRHSCQRPCPTHTAGLIRKLAPCGSEDQAAYSSLDIVLRGRDE